MRYCPECGKEIQPRVKFCPECGTALATAGDAGPRPPRVSGRTHTGFGLLRTTTILETALGAAFLVLGALSISSAVALLVFWGVGGLAVVSGYGVLKRKAWSRLAGTVAGVVLVLVGLLFARTFDAILAPLGALCILLGAALALQLRLRSAEEYLGIRAPVPSED